MNIIPGDGDRDGNTFNHDFDYDRLNKQARAVYNVLSDNEWHTLAELEEATEHPQASISARIRDLRKQKFGKHIVLRRRAAFGGGTWEYQLEPRVPSGQLV